MLYSNCIYPWTCPCNSKSTKVPLIGYRPQSLPTPLLPTSRWLNFDLEWDKDRIPTFKNKTEMYNLLTRTTGDT